jgi:hypothetical protein
MIPEEQESLLDRWVVSVAELHDLAENPDQIRDTDPATREPAFFEDIARIR